MHAYRSHTCGDLTAAHAGETVRLSGWVHRVRDHGGVLFVDLRDHYGMTQVLADSDSPAFAAQRRPAAAVGFIPQPRTAFTSPPGVRRRSYSGRKAFRNGTFSTPGAQTQAGVRYGLAASCGKACPDRRSADL